MINENLLQKLLDEEKVKITSGKGLYTQKSFEYLTTDSMYMVGQFTRHVIPILPKEKWPHTFCELHKKYEADKQRWHQNTFYHYTMDALVSDCVSPAEYLFHIMPSFGYAVTKEKLIPTAFFIILQHTGKVERMDDLIPEEWAFDPIGYIDDQEILGYIGVQLERGSLEDWLLEKGSVNTPIEMLADERIKKISEEKQWQKEIIECHIGISYSCF